MVWQDIAISIICVLFSYALVPQVIKGFREKKPNIAKQTGIINFLGMTIISGIYLTLNLYFSSIISVTTAILWLMLLIQSIKYKSI
jgi:hypothetical protein